MSSNKMLEKPKSLINVMKLPRYYAAYKIYSKLEYTQGKYRNLKKLSSIFKSSPKFYRELTRISMGKQSWEQAIVHIDSAIKLLDNTNGVPFYKFKAECLDELGEIKESVKCLDIYLKFNPDDYEAWLNKANKYIYLLEWNKAVESFKKYLEMHPKDSSVHYQIGECFFNLKKYVDAENYFKEATRNLENNFDSQSIALVYYKLGLMQFYNNKIAFADNTFSLAINKDIKLESKRYGIGVFHEKFEQWEFAVTAFQNKLIKNKEDAKLSFKLGSLLDKMNKPEQAIVYYKNALRIDKVLSPWHFALANCYDQLKDYRNAAYWYKNAIARQVKHRPTNYRRLGNVLKKLGRDKQALKAYSEAELFNCPVDVKQDFYEKNINKLRIRYAISYEYYSLNDKMVFYESLNGKRITGNPYALFKYILNHQEFTDFIHIWVVESFTVIPSELKSKENIIFVKKGTDAYLKYVASAKYLICNNTLADYVVRKPNQLYLQTSHGIFYKTVGRDSSSTPLGVAGATRNLLQSTHIIMPNEYMVEKQQKSYSIKDIASGKIARIGYPRVDATIDLSEEEKGYLSSTLKLDISKKTVFYAPTWRGNTKSNNWFNSSKLIQDLKQLADMDINLIFRSHAETENLISNIQLPSSVIVPTDDIQTNEILSLTDVLITDYSSIFFDFLVTDRPIIHYVYDIQEYSKERGLNLKEEELPGIVVKDITSLVSTVKETNKKSVPSRRYQDAKNKFCPYDDGNSTNRVVNWFFFRNEEEVDFVERKNASESVLLLGGEFKDSEPTFFVFDSNKRKKSDNIVSVMLQKDVEENKDNLTILEGLKTNINIILNAGVMPKTLEEAEAIEYLNSYGKFKNKKMELKYQRVFVREVRRLFGDSKFDYVYNYESNSNYWKALIETITSNKKS